MGIARAQLQALSAIPGDYIFDTVRQGRLPWPSWQPESVELAGAELELRHLRIKAQGQPTDGGPTTAEQIPDAEKEVGRLEQEYEAEAQRVREAKEGGLDERGRLSH